jgi:hypothetical protein
MGNHMNNKGSIEAQWFIIFGIVLVALTSLALFSKITSIMENEEFFYEYHGDQIVMLMEAMATTSRPTSAVYSLGEVTFRTLQVDKKPGETGVLRYADGREKYILLHENHNYDASLSGATSKILITYGDSGFALESIGECPENAAVGISTLIYNPQSIPISDARALYIVAKDRATECALRKKYEEEHDTRRPGERIFSTINQGIGEAYGGGYDAIVTVFPNE